MGLDETIHPYETLYTQCGQSVPAAFFLNQQHYSGCISEDTFKIHHQIDDFIPLSLLPVHSEVALRLHAVLLKLI